jgi:hypothetical protein
LCGIAVMPIAAKPAMAAMLPMRLVSDIPNLLMLAGDIGSACNGAVS